MTRPPRLELARLPTPLQRFDRLREAWGGPTLWVKRDDLTGFGLSGNKVRKLEYHLAAAREAGADVVITCGAAQSNHCRATAIASAPLGVDVVVVLRTGDGEPPPHPVGNHLLMLLAGAEPRYVTPDGYRHRDEAMAGIAAEMESAGRRPWVIPEGASDSLGMWGFVTAMEELAGQIEPIGSIAAVWHATSSGGTTAGLAWVADAMETPIPVVGCSVGETAAEVSDRIEAIWAAAAADLGVDPPARLPEIVDAHVGLGYGLVTPEELAIQAEATRLTGLLFDPTYTGKALAGLRREITAGRFGEDDHVVFWHTGGGFALFAHDFPGM